MHKQKLIRCLAALLFLFSISPAWAAPWGVVANVGWFDPLDPDSAHEAIYTLDLGTTPPTVYGPFLEGQLVPLDPVTNEPQYGGQMLDVAYIPGTNDALISNFGASTVYRINFDNPTKPRLVGSVLLQVGTDPLDPDFKSMFAEDIAVTTDGKLAIVADGGFASRIAFINLETLTLNSLFELYEGVPFDPADPPAVLPPLFYANAVAITPDNKTVIMADYFSGVALYGRINSAGDGLESVSGLHLCPNWDAVAETCGVDDYLSWPVNVSISPDGKTALLADAMMGMVTVLNITGPGQVQAGAPFQLWGFPDTYADFLAGQPARGHCQSIAFAPDGKRAYMLQNDNYPSADPIDPLLQLQDQLSWVRIDGPGQASVGGVWVAMLYSRSSGQLFGVDTLVVGKDGKNAYASNPIPSGAVKTVSRINLQDFSTSAVHVNSTFPVGLEILGRKFPWPMFLPAMKNNNAQP